jgi:hypothetical protein
MSLLQFLQIIFHTILSTSVHKSLPEALTVCQFVSFEVIHKVF